MLQRLELTRSTIDFVGVTAPGWGRGWIGGLGGGVIRAAFDVVGVPAPVGAEPDLSSFCFRSCGAKQKEHNNEN